MGALERSRPLLTKIAVVVAAGVAAGVTSGWILAQFVHLPQVDQLATFRPATTTEIVGPDGQTLASYAIEQRIELTADQIPEHLKLAIVAIEDAEFYEHGGVDPKAIARAAAVTLRNVVTGRDRLITQGGSTLTQQLALNLFLKRENTLQRKIKEALLAIDIEKRYTKDQILTLYANQIFFGHGAYGVEAAARLYFDKPALELTLPEAALIAGIIPSANNRYNPYTRPDAALQRRNKVLDRMLELGFIERPAHDAAVAAPLAVGFHREYISNGAYFLETVRKQVEELYGTSELYTGGLRVHITMDPRLQAIAERVVRRGLIDLERQWLGFRRPPNVLDEGLAQSPDAYQDPSWNHLVLQPSAMVRAVVQQVTTSQATLRFAGHTATLSLDGAGWTRTGSLARILRPGDLVLAGLPDVLPIDPAAPIPVELLQEPKVEGALVAIDNSSGAILAMVGGFDFARSEFNRAMQSTLQCGSAFKPFVYLTAFEQGFTPADTIFDAPFLLPDSTGALNYCPRNYYNRYYGITTLRRALEHSYNSSAVKLQQLAGGDAVVDMAKRFGIGTELHPFPSLALGAMEVRLIDLVRAYAGIANLGDVPEPYAITAVYDRDGRPVEKFYPRSQRAISAPAAYLALSVLEGVIDRGTGNSAASIPANLAGKTGTTDRYTDAWFVGFSPRITVGVWVGRDVKAPIGRKMTGAVAAQPLWNEFMKAYLETVDESERTESFSIPSGIVFSPVDYATGESALPPCSYHSRVILEAFLDTTEPNQRPCGARPANLSELPWPFQVAFYSPRPGEPMPTAAAVEVANQRAGSGDEEEAGD